MLGFLLCGYFSIEHHGVHSIVLEPSSREYSTYSKRILTSNQPFHNIYLRLQQRMTGGYDTPHPCQMHSLSYLA